jgi:hypothetical protein
MSAVTAYYVRVAVRRESALRAAEAVAGLAALALMAYAVWVAAWPALWALGLF